MEFTTFLSERAAQVEKALDEFLPREDAPPSQIHRAMRYSALDGGKRLRGILATTCCEVVSGQAETALPVAAAIEMIHAYSLVHDDLPCMDDDDLRRGKPTAHKVFGEAIALLAGDALLTKAFSVLSLLPKVADVPPAVSLAILAEIAEAAGTAGMVGGQVADLEAEGRVVEENHLRFIHARKTGALIRASCRAGAMAGKADAQSLNSLTFYAEYLGTAFQIMDDILDVVGDPKQTGKAIGRDVRKKKVTFPALMGLERAAAEARRLVGQAKEAIDGLGPKAFYLVQLADYVVTRTG